MGGGLWTLQFLYWVVVSIRLASTGKMKSKLMYKAVKIKVNYDPGVRIYPGSYFFLIFARKRSVRGGWVHRLFKYDLTTSFPRTLIWYKLRPSMALDGRGTKLTFLLPYQRRVSEFYGMRDKKKNTETLLLDGSYGRNMNLGNYESVVLVAKGMSIAGILSSAFSLTYRWKHHQRLFRDLNPQSGNPLAT